MLPHVVIVPLCGGITFVVTAAIALLGTGTLVAGYAAMVRSMFTGGGGGGHGYGMILGVVGGALVVSASASAAALLVITLTVLAVCAGMIVSGLIDLLRLPRGIARADTRYPKVWGAWAAAITLLSVASVWIAAATSVGGVHGVDVLAAVILGGFGCFVAIGAGLIVRTRARR